MKIDFARIVTSFTSIAVSLMLAPAGFAQSASVFYSAHAPMALAGMALVEDSTDKQGDGDDAGMAGLWQYSYVSEGSAPVAPDGAVVDAGYKMLTSDHTEIVVTAARAPVIDNVCVGVWKKTGEHTYAVNHFGASWLPDPSAPLGYSFQGPANVREALTLSEDGKSFTGTFTVDQFDNAKNLLVHLQGKLMGKRLTITSKESPFPF